MSSAGVAQAGGDAVDGGGDGAVEFGRGLVALGDEGSLAAEEFDLDEGHRVDVGIAQADGVFEDVVLFKQRGLALSDADYAAVETLMPDWLTPGAAEVLAVKAFRATRTLNKSAAEALRYCLEGYRPPVAREILEFQIRLAIAEASDPSFVPVNFKALGEGRQ